MRACRTQFGLSPRLRQRRFALLPLRGEASGDSDAPPGDRSPASAIVEAFEEIRASNGYDIVSTPTWHTDLMIVVGDAAHAAAPNVGHGASMAMEDAVVLAKCLRDVRRRRGVPGL